jgi:glyoxylase-like metal-dependent hydrolase (beta-lactamase superfamily II)
MVDPDFCVWKSWEENVAEWNADLDLLERETGLKTIERVLLTHYHGDHVQYCGELRKRYGSTIVATADVAAVCERPREYGYPCAVDWYNFPFDHVTIDEHVAYERAFHWHEMALTPIHTPGHCNAHASFLTDWAGHRILIGGDVIQYGQGAIACPMPIMYNDNAWPDRGLMATLRRISDRGIEYILGGHSHACHDPQGETIAEMVAVAHESLQLARRMVPGGDTLRAMTPPHYDAIRPQAEEAISGHADPGRLAEHK